jgi:arylsulfate sulfotransferase
MNRTFWLSLAFLTVLGSPAYGTVTILSFQPSIKPPRVIGTSIIWTATATDTGSGPLAFQFNVAPPGGTLAMARDFNTGTVNAGTWTSLPFVWAPTGTEGIYQVQVVIKDFRSGETASKTVPFGVKPLVTGTTPVVIKTANALVALFSAPSCPQGSAMRVSFQPFSGSTPATTTNYVACHPPYTMTFEIAGMYPNTIYQMFSQTNTAGRITNGPVLMFKSSALPSDVTFPSFQVLVPSGAQTDTADPVILRNFNQLGSSTIYADVATDLAGKIIWYYWPTPVQSIILTRPLSGGGIITIQNGPVWNLPSERLQLLRQIDLAGNIIRETNTGAIEQQLLALGARDAGPCASIPRPAPVGAGCLDSFHHDAIQTLPNGDVALFVNIEKILPPGAQGDTSGLPVDVLGDMIVIADSNWQVKWYFDAFQHASGAPQLDINRPATLGETCSKNEQGCPPMFLLGSGIAPLGKDWLHCNSLDYRPQDGDILLSCRNQDWVMKVDYQNGAGTGNILWRMGPCGDFTFDNINNDPWPWFSGQHDVGMENRGAGPLTMFDNGDTRVSPPSGAGSSSGCMPGVGSGNSRGMALTFDEATMTVTPVLSVDLGVFSTGSGSAQLLSNGNYYFLPAVVLVNLNTEDSYSMEVLPTPSSGTGAQVLNIQGPTGYRGWQMKSLYQPPTT